MKLARDLRLLLLLLLAGALPGRVEAQEALHPAAPSGWSEGAPVPVLAAAGVLGGVVGLAGGFYAVNAVCPIDDSLYCSAGAGLAAAGGESALLPLAVHLANGRRGSYPRALLASAALGALGAAVFAATDSDSPLRPVAAVAVPVSQLAASIFIERRTARPRPAAPLP